MGVPAFFRWLSRKYPSIVVHCKEEKSRIVNGVKIPVDCSKPNPNDVEFDNLYLDMNGIIHPCCHPENKPAPKNEDEMMVAIFEYIDRIFSIVRPRRLLYMAIDGVAPRAKMNQQRSRRFRASKESVEKVLEISRVREELKSKGFEVPPEKPKEEHFDSNCITPGTPFMARLAKCLHYYIHERLNNDPGWKNIQIILSDANVPGEGEHKIMDYIRRQRASPNHDPNTRHCLCGADADLIMLGLATHEPNFTIIREEFKPNQPRPCELCGQLGHELKECTGAAKPKEEFDLEKPIEQDVEFIFIRLNVLREYLEKELTMHHLPFPFDLERVIDDWVFMCFFVGNDFLPHLPSLEIREGAIDRLVNLYKSTVYRTGGFLTDSGRVDLKRVQLIMTDLGDVEDEIFKKRQANEIAFRERQKERKKRMKLLSDKPAWVPAGQFRPLPIGSSPSPVQNARQEAYQMRMHSTFVPASSSKQSDNEALTSLLNADGSKEKQNSEPKHGEKRKHDGDDSEEEPEDNVRLWEDGWKDRYYEIKFEVSKDNIPFRHKVAAAYVEGLCWVLRYYYQGCASWKWYFPYHYAPFASDFLNIGDLNLEFERGTQPFKPLEQLMGVFPAASRQHVPEPWAELMINPESSIIDFYPDDFKIDLNGKKYAWQGVALLPFVEERRLLKALRDVYPLLTEAEIKRNVRGHDRFYIRRGHNGYDYLIGLYESNRSGVMFDINPRLFYGASGKVLLAEDVIGPDETVACPIDGLTDLPGNAAVCVSFCDPQYPEDFIFSAVRLADAVDPPKVLKPGEMPVTDNRQQWRPQIGMAPAKHRAFLSAPGHRMLERNMNNAPYGQVPPPDQYRRGRSYNPSAGSPLSAVVLGAGHTSSTQISPWQHQQQDDQAGSSRGWYSQQPSIDRNSRGAIPSQNNLSRWGSQSRDADRRDDYSGQKNYYTGSRNYTQSDNTGGWGPMNPSGSSARDNRNAVPLRDSGSSAPSRMGRDSRDAYHREDSNRSGSYMVSSNSGRWSNSSGSSYSSYRRQ